MFENFCSFSRFFIFSAVAAVFCFESRMWAGPLEDTNFFPIAVWLQQPKNAARFKEAGINTYVGLWRGPTDEHITALTKAEMYLVCSQNSLALSHTNNRTIIAWMHGDEPDNAQSLAEKKGYGPPILPSKIIGDYEKMKKADPSRPVFLNLGQGIAWDKYIGRGVRRNHPEDYPEYVKGCDIASFDIYPVVHDSPEIAGKLEYVAKGVERLRNWAGPTRKVWNCIECTHISNPARKTSPAQVRAEVWMSLIHGSKGIIYFVHEFKPVFKEAALLDDTEMLAAVKGINQEIKTFAPLLNSPTINGYAEMDAGIAGMVKQSPNKKYLFLANMENREREATIRLPKTLVGKVQVFGTDRSVLVANHSFKDKFEPYGIRIYEVDSRP